LHSSTGTGKKLANPDTDGNYPYQLAVIKNTPGFSGYSATRPASNFIHRDKTPFRRFSDLYRDTQLVLFQVRFG